MSDTPSPRQSATTPSSMYVSMPGGSVSTVLLYPAAAQFSSAAAGSPRPLVVVWPGFGMGARYYRPLAEELARRGFPVAVGELRGQGSSTAVASLSSRWGYHDMASQDYPRTVRAAKAWFDLEEDHPTVLLTHSMGGQIGALFLARPEAAELGVVGMMGVGTGSPYHRAFPDPEKRRLRIGGVVMRAVSSVLGYWPAGPLDVANYGRQSGVHLREWARFGRTNSLEDLKGRDIDYMDAMQKVSVPVLLTRFVDDDFCTVESCRALASLLPKTFARIEELPETLGHNRWAREPGPVADRLEAFVGQIRADRTGADSTAAASGEPR